MEHRALFRLGFGFLEEVQAGAPASSFEALPPELLDTVLRRAAFLAGPRAAVAVAEASTALRAAAAAAEVTESVRTCSCYASK